MRLVIAALLLTPVLASGQAKTHSLDRVLNKETLKSIDFDSMPQSKKDALGAILKDVYRTGFEDARRSIPVDPPKPPGFETKVDSEFNGWEGETIVKLANGQIWQQDEYHYNYLYAYRPDVLVCPVGGSYKMMVEGTDQAIRVKRLK